MMRGDLGRPSGGWPAALQAKVPRCIYRFQRRATYRVRTLDRGAPHASFNHPAIPDMQLCLRIIDLSIGGCALLLPMDVPPLEPGTVLRGVVLDLDTDVQLRVSLRLQHVSSIIARQTGLRLGCELLDPDGNSERTLQRYIDHTQKRRRLLSLD